MATLGALDSKVAVITGTGAGIGRAAALRFAAAGARVLGADVDDAANNETGDLVAAAGGTMIAVPLDVTDLDAVEAVVAEAEARWGGVDVMFNNAGVMLPSDGDVLEVDAATIETTMAINVTGVLNGCRAAIPAMRRRGRGSIVNTASFVASLGAATPQIAYTASKGAVLALTRELAVTHARDHIRVNAVSPGPLQTELLMRVLDTEAKRQRRLVHVPMGRFGEADEIAAAALFLASDDASFITGANLNVDGGLTAAYVTPE